MSRYDYPDPGTDPAYCNGISDEPDLETPCAWCGESLSTRDEYPYCSTLCALYAERDSMEDYDVSD